MNKPSFDKSKKILIINADDLGYSPEVNDAIFFLMEKKAVSSATMLANSHNIRSAAVQSKKFVSCSFGIHLCLTEFKPITRAGGELPFIGSDGCFDQRSFRRVHVNGKLKQNIYEEWCGQVRELQRLGVNISHIDSHHHVHTVPWLFSVLKSVQRTFGIRKVRISMNLYYKKEHDPGMMLIAKKVVFNTALRSLFRTRTTEYFTKLDWFAKLYCSGNRIPGRSIELMVHPGNVGYTKENNLLLSGFLDETRRSYKMISYNEL